nr:aminotransferase class V-fold PLP-dependent enzyme [Candidatus Ozemobacteraceae bacterium]
MTELDSSRAAPADAWEQRLSELLDRLRRESETYLGYPNNQLLDHQNLAPFLDLVINNIGDPEIGNFGLHTCEFEREVIAFFSELYRLSTTEGWGYVTNGGTESNLHGLLTGRERFPGAPLLFSEDSHYSVEKAGRLLGLNREPVRSSPNGEIDYEALEATLSRLRPPAVILNANIGTTMKGAIDDVPRIIETLRRKNINRYYIHCDAALFGGFLPFLPGAPCVDFSLPIDSIAISGHKFIGSGIPCGIL